MHLVFHPLRTSRLDRLTAEDEQLLLENARVLLDTPPSRAGSLLRGKNLGLLCQDGEPPCLFRDAAQALGARVSHIRPSLSRASDPAVIRDTARVLSRLYDGLECRDLPADLVRRIGNAAGVPVYDGISSPTHPTAALAPKLAPGARGAGQLPIVQALLLSTLL